MIVIFLTCGRMLPERKEIGAKKLLVEDKIKNTACVKEICLMGVVCKVLNRKRLEFLNILLSLIMFAICNTKFCVSSNLLFFLTSCQQPTVMNVLLFSCNPIGQLWLSGPGYSGRTVMFAVRDHK